MKVQESRVYGRKELLWKELYNMKTREGVKKTCVLLD